MRRPDPKRDARIGIIGVLFALVFVYGSFTKRVPFVSGYRVEAVFTSSNNLRTGSPVRIAGVDVGKIVKLKNGPGTTAIVVMQIKGKGRPIHSDAEVRIRPRLFLEGGFYVDLRPGSPSAPEIKDNGTIPLGQTAIPVQFDQILSGGFPRANRESLRRVLDEVDTALKDGGAEGLGAAAPPLVPALRDTAIIAKAAQGIKRHDLSDTVRSLSRITAALDSNEQALGGLVTGLARTTGALASEQGALSASVREADAVLTEAPSALAALDRSLPAARRLLADLRPSLPLAPPVLRGAVRVVDQLDRATRPSELPALVDHLKLPVKTLPQLETRLTELFGLVTPVTDCVRDRALPVLNTKLEDGRFSSNQPVWQELLHATVGLNSAAANYDGNGGMVRYLFGAGDQSISLGSVPGLGTLAGTAAEPISGLRPKWKGLAGAPPFRPDAVCRDQAAPNLQVAASPVTRGAHLGPRGKRAKVSLKSFEKALKALTPKDGRR